MENPFQVPVIIVVGLYIVSELLLLRFPTKNYVKYLPGIVGFFAGIIFGYVSYLSLEGLNELITPLYFALNLTVLSLLVMVIMSMRKPFKRKSGHRNEENTEDDSIEEESNSDRIELETDDESLRMEQDEAEKHGARSRTQV